MMKRSLRLVASFGLAVVFLYLFFRRLDLSEILAHVRQARPEWLFVAVIMQGLHLTLRSLRWGVLLTPIKKHPRFYNLFSTTAIGYLLSFALFRVGEVVRPLMLGQREGISKTGTMATCLLERLMDFFTVASLLGFYMVFRFDPATASTGGLDLAWIRGAGLVFGLGTLACFPLLYVMIHYRQRLFESLDRSKVLGALLPRLLHSFLGGFDAVRGGRIFSLAWAYSLAIWLSIAGSIWASLEAFDLGIGYADSLLMLALLTFGVAVPTPGAVGSFEYLGKLGLVEVFAVESNRAAAAILVTHVFAIGPVILAGIVLLWKDGLSFRGLTQVETEAPVSSSVAGAGR
ncbi:MAG: lysylphosphatidylglycerol synthase transmembrane domain-containing protein [Acidobacteriota bacterium]